MQDKSVALVTGANKGIGLETVRRLVDAGHIAYLAARDENENPKLLELSGCVRVSGS